MTWGALPANNSRGFLVGGVWVFGAPSSGRRGNDGGFRRGHAPLGLATEKSPIWENGAKFGNGLRIEEEAHG